MSTRNILTLAVAVGILIAVNVVAYLTFRSPSRGDRETSTVDETYLPVPPPRDDDGVDAGDIMEMSDLEFQETPDTEKEGEMELPLPPADESGPRPGRFLHVTLFRPTDLLFVCGMAALMLATLLIIIRIAVKGEREIKAAEGKVNGNGAAASEGDSGESLAFLEFDLAERMSGIGRPARGHLPKFRNESLPWGEAVQHVFDIPEWKGLYRIRFVFDNDDDADFEPVFVLVGEVPVEKEFVAALSCLLSGRISREAFLMETGLPQDTTWTCDDAGFFSIYGGACYPFAVFGELNSEYGCQYRKRYEDITGNVIRILNGWDPAVLEEPVVEDIDDTIIDDVPVNETDPDDTGEEGGDSLVDFSDSNNDYFIV